MNLEQIGVVVSAIAFTAGVFVMAVALYVGGLCLYDAWVEWHRRWQLQREIRRQERVQEDASLTILKTR